MAGFIAWPRLGEAVHDLEHAAELSAERLIWLRVSPQSLYVLQNLASQDATLQQRYATALGPGGYYAVDEADVDDFALYLDIVSRLGVELSEYMIMSTPLNYKEALNIQTSNLNAAAGSNTLSIQGPGTDEAWVIDHVAFQDHNSGVTDAILYLTNGTTNYILDQRGALGADAWRHYAGPIHLSNDMALNCLFTGCTLNDDLYLQVTGHSMELIP